VLERLDDIDWAALRHAYGSARDTPRWIRGLASTDPRVRAQAQNDFDAAVLHQGFVYEATPWAIPFLFELLSNRETPDRPEIASLIAVAANSIVWGRKDSDLLSKTAPPEFQIFDRIEEELTAALPTLGRLGGAGETDGEVRLWVLEILRTLNEAAAPVVKLLPSFREEPDVLLRTSLLYLAHVAGLTDLALVRTCLDEDGSPLVRWTAALVELRTERQRTSARAIGELVAALEPGSTTLNRTGPLLEQPLTTLTVAAGEAGPEIAARLLPALLRHAAIEPAAELEKPLDIRSELGALLQGRVDVLEPDFFAALLSSVFGPPPATLRSPLSETQRKVLHSVAQAAWTPGRVSIPGMGRAFRLLQTFGFPTERAKLQEMIGPELLLPPRWPRPPRVEASRSKAHTSWIGLLLRWSVPGLIGAALLYSVLSQRCA